MASSSSSSGAIGEQASETVKRAEGGVDALEDVGRAFRRVIEAGREATRRVDGEELREKGEDLRRGADEARAGSEAALARLASVRSERLRLAFLSSSAEFGSDDATWYLDGLAAADGDDDGRGTATTTGTTTTDRVALMQSIMTFRHPIGQDIVAFAAAESEYGARVRERAEVDRTSEAMRRALASAEDDARHAAEVRYRILTWPCVCFFGRSREKNTAGLPCHAAFARVSSERLRLLRSRRRFFSQAEERARKALEDAQRRVVESQKILVETQRRARDVDGTVRRADSELTKANALLRRKRDAVRRELRRRAAAAADDGNKNDNNAAGGRSSVIFDMTDDGRVRLREKNDDESGADGGSSTVFYVADDGRVRLNPGFEYRSSMDSMGFETRTKAAIEALRGEELRIGGECAMLAEKAGRLASRSERLRLRSEELIGERRRQQQQQQQRADYAQGSGTEAS